MKAKITEGLKKHLVTLILSGAMAGYIFVKDLVATGAEVKFKDKVTVVVKSKDIKMYLDSLFDDKIEATVKNPFVWFDVLNSDFVGQYAETKATEVREEVERKLIEQDSVNKSFIRIIGETIGKRDEDVIPLFGKMMKKYLKEVRHVRATF